MTADEFKQLKPECRDLSGVELANAMEDYLVRQQQGYQITKIVLPFWKRYTVRWLFYRRLPNWTLFRPGYTRTERCVLCKKGIGIRTGFLYQGKLYLHCEHCKQDLQVEPNNNIDHILYKKWSVVAKGFWLLLDKIHLVRSSHHGRYDMFGDEVNYLRGWTVNSETGQSWPIHRPRKWWEYIFIERQFKPKLK